MPHHRFPLLPLRWLACCLLLSSAASAQDDLSRLRAQAIRGAVQRVAASVVTVERIGTQTAGGELTSDAPTSAVAIDDDRHFIASSLAVTGNPATILLVSASGQRSVADVVARDHSRQLVLLRAQQTLDVPPLQPVAADPVVGQTVIAVGRQAADQSLAISHGILSGTGRNWGLALQTDARVSAPFYGGPLIDLYGRFLGVIVPMVPDGGAEEDTGWYDSGVAFAIDAPSIWQRLDKLRSGADVRQGLVGIVAKGNDPYQETASIAAVRPRSPGAAAGLQPGDEVIAINDTPIHSHREVKQTLGPLDAGTEIVVTVKRDDQSIPVSLTLTDSIPPLEMQRIGITAMESRDETAAATPADQISSADQVPPKDQAESADLPRAIIVTTVVAESPADGKLQVGDRISGLQGTELTDLESFKRQVLLADPDAPITLDVVRNGQTLEPLKIQTTAITLLRAGDLPAPAASGDGKTAGWKAQEWKVADLTNAVVVVAPASGVSADVDTSESRELGLLVLLMPPGTSDLQKAAADWQAAASAAGIVVCLVAPVDEARWTPDEVDVPQRLAASLRQSLTIDTAQQAIAGIGPGATLAMASALMRPGTFAGLSVPSDSSPPRMRLRENDPAAPLQLLITEQTSTIDSDDIPGWQRALRTVGFPVLVGDDDPTAILAWVRSLAVI